MKYIKIICFLSVICLLVTGCGLAGGHRNTTGSTKYSAADVEFNCKNVDTNENRTLTTYVDVLFNTSRGYQAEQYIKMIAKYNQTITDEKYREIVKGIDATKCLSATECTESHLELGLTTLGFDTVVDRNSDTVEVSFYKAMGKGYTAKQSDKDLVKKTYTDENFTCN